MSLRPTGCGLSIRLQVDHNVTDYIATLYSALSRLSSWGQVYRWQSSWLFRSCRGRLRCGAFLYSSRRIASLLVRAACATGDQVAITPSRHFSTLDLMSLPRDHSAISEGSTPIARTTHRRILTTIPRLSVRRGFRGCLRSFLETVVMAFAQTSDVSANPVCPGVNCKHEFWRSVVPIGTTATVEARG
jgi:hypothetical protein